MLAYQTGEGYAFCPNKCESVRLRSIEHPKQATPTLSVDDSCLQHTGGDIAERGFLHLPRFPWIRRKVNWTQGESQTL